MKPTPLPTPSQPESRDEAETSRAPKLGLVVGKPITVVYTIKDLTEWRKTNPLRYVHDGLEAYCVSIGDLAARRDVMRAALEEIERIGDHDVRQLARAALEVDDRPC